MVSVLFEVKDILSLNIFNFVKKILEWCLDNKVSHESQNIRVFHELD